MGSDHIPILTSIWSSNTTTPLPSSDPRPRFLYKKANWTIFSQHCKDCFDDFLFTSNLTTNYSNFVDILHKATELAIPRAPTGKKFSRPPNPWWDEECSASVASRRAAVAANKRLMSRESLLAMKLACAKTTKLLHSKKTILMAKLLQ
jgi:hypothetical protein